MGAAKPIATTSASGSSAKASKNPTSETEADDGAHRLQARLLGGKRLPPAAVQDQQSVSGSSANRLRKNTISMTGYRAVASLIIASMMP